MSASLAAARKRRGVAIQEPPVAVSAQTQAQSAPGLTLPQVIALVDKRLSILETFMKDQKENPVQPVVAPQQTSMMESITTDVIKAEIEAMAEEFNNRYELLASEIQDMKDIVLKLQSFTMEVNKTLMDERVRILSDVENSANLTIDEDELEENA